MSWTRPAVVVRVFVSRPWMASLVCPSPNDDEDEDEDVDDDDDDDDYLPSTIERLQSLSLPVLCGMSHETIPFLHPPQYI